MIEELSFQEISFLFFLVPNQKEEHRQNNPTQIPGGCHPVRILDAMGKKTTLMLTLTITIYLNETCALRSR